MRKRYLTSRLLGVLLGVFAWTAIGFGQDSGGTTTVTVNVAARFVPASALGLVLVPDGVIQKPEPKIERVSPEYVVVSFTVNRSEIARDSMATAIVMSDASEVAFGDVKPLIPPQARSSFWSLPECTEPQRDPVTLVNDSGLLESLVGIRTQRREANKKRLATLLDPSFQAKLSKAEAIFGLTQGTPISADLPPNELVDRASRLLQAVKNVDLAANGSLVPNQSKTK